MGVMQGWHPEGMPVWPSSAAGFGLVAACVADHSMHHRNRFKTGLPTNG